MHQLRRLLILLLCLAVPLSGWASVAGTESCAARAGAHAHAHSHGAQPSAHHHDEASEHRTASHDAGKPDKCDSSCKHGCACGCGMGACTAGFASLFEPQSLVLLFGHDGRIAGPGSDAPLPARGAVPLRPPIA